MSEREQLSRYSALIYDLHNWCNEVSGDISLIIESGQELMSAAADALSALSETSFTNAAPQVPVSASAGADGKGAVSLTSTGEPLLPHSPISSPAVAAPTDKNRAPIPPTKITAPSPDLQEHLAKRRLDGRTPRVDALARDHYYECSAEAAGMVVSAKSPEECYREMRDLAVQLERELRTASAIQEPTQAMLDAAWLALAELFRGEGGWIGKEAAYEQARLTWRAMIGAR